MPSSGPVDYRQELEWLEEEPYDGPDGKIPMWMKGLTMATKYAARKAHMIKYWELNKSPLLTDLEELDKTTNNLVRFWHVFAWNVVYSKTHLIQLSIKMLPDQPPINERYRLLNPALEDSLMKQLRN